jgi:two-component system, NarL family, response regulator DesR
MRDKSWSEVDRTDCRRAGPDMIRILLAEDMALIRGALAALIDREPDLCVVGEADDGHEMLAAAIGCNPDVAIIDIDRPAFDLAHASRLRERLPTCRTLVLTSLGRPGVMHGVLAAAVSGFILKDAPACQLATAVRNVAAGGSVVGPELTSATWSPAYIPLSRRERTVLRIAGGGAEPTEIAAELNLSVGTVRNYLTAIVSKLHARNRVDAIRKAYELGWLP